MCPPPFFSPPKPDILLCRLLEQARKQVLTPVAVVNSFFACGYRPFGFPGSYAAQKLPQPTPNPPGGQEPDNTGATGSQATTATEVVPFPRSTFSTLAKSAPPTPQRASATARMYLDATRKAAARSRQLEEAHSLIRYQQNVIHAQHASAILQQTREDQVIAQLAAKSSSKRIGGVLKSGYGALDAAALDELIAAQAHKDELAARKVAARAVRGQRGRGRVRGGGIARHGRGKGRGSAPPSANTSGQANDFFASNTPPDQQENASDSDDDITFAAPIFDAPSPLSGRSSRSMSLAQEPTPQPPAEPEPPASAPRTASKTFTRAGRAVKRTQRAREWDEQVEQMESNA